MKKTAIALYIIALFLGIGVANAQVLDAPTEKNKDSFYEHVHAGKYKPLEYPHVREADVVWALRIWREIKFNEKINQFFYYPLQPDQGRVSFMHALVEAAKEGKIKLYEDDEFKRETTWQVVEKNNAMTSVQEIVDPDDPTNTHDSVITKNLSTSDIKALRIKEDWFLDRARSVRDVRISGFCAVIDAQNEAGEFKGVMELFWVRYNDPEVREILANTEAYNSENDKERMSYDDVFIKRYFSSYIYRKSNDQSRSISAYLAGADALAQAEEIEELLFNKDEDMWEY